MLYEKFTKKIQSGQYTVYVKAAFLDLCLVPLVLQISSLHPEEFAEYVVRVYYRKKYPKKVKHAKECFKWWCHDKVSDDVLFVTPAELTHSQVPQKTLYNDLVHI